jgi:hypothetical protein
MHPTLGNVLRVCCCVNSQKFFDCPNAIGQTASHRGCEFVRGVNAAEIEMGDKERNLMFQVSQLL